MSKHASHPWVPVETDYRPDVVNNSYFAALRRIAGSLLKPITYPTLHIAILLLANPIVLLIFTRALLLILMGLSASILVSLLWLYVFFSLVANYFLDVFSLVHDAIYTCFFIIGRWTQFTQASMEVFFPNFISGAFGQFSIGR